MAQNSITSKAVNLWVSRVIPFILIGLVGYVTWVVVVNLCVHYLLKTSVQLQSRSGSAIAILVLYSLLLILIAVTYFRLLYTVVANPGYVPRGPKWQAEHRQKRKSRHRPSYRRKTEKASTNEKVADEAESRESNQNQINESDYGGAFYAPGSREAASSLQYFFSRDVFLCQGDGRPVWCSTCLNWKPDRAHHCREIDRCVRKMDHFCPWVGGVVSETSFKFFIQFVAWTALYCLFNLIIAAYYVADYHKKTGDVRVHFLIWLCLAGLFFLFTLGMTLSSLQFALQNTTTIENLSRKTAIWTLAIRMPQSPEAPPSFRTISYSLNGTIRTFAILHTKPGESPYGLGYYQNFKSVMGERWLDWVLPIRHSPCTNHNRDESQYPMGSVVDRLRQDAGIATPDNEQIHEKPHRRVKRRRHRPRRSDEAEKDKVAPDKVSEKMERNFDQGGHDIDLEAGLRHMNSYVE